MDELIESLTDIATACDDLRVLVGTLLRDGNDRDDVFELIDTIRRNQAVLVAKLLTPPDEPTDDETAADINELLG